jgi:hypothetical protein
LAQWRVHLQGKQFDLDELREILANNDPTIIQDDSNYYLISTEWNQSHDFTDIHNRAKEFVGLLENAAYLDSNETAPFSVVVLLELMTTGGSIISLLPNAGITLW